MTPLRHLAAATLPIALATAAGAAEPVQALLDERAVVRIADAIDRAVDARDWPRVRGYFADEVTVDFSTLTGQPPATIPADVLVGGWAGNLKGTKTSLHLRTNHDVAIEGDGAAVVSNGYAWNRMEGNGDPLWEVWGVYEHRLARTAEGWEVEGFTFRVTHERGNPWVKNTPGQ